MLHHTRRWNRESRRGAPQRVAERRRGARLGERLRLVGRLERARQGDAPRDDARAARATRSCSTTASGRRSRRTRRRARRASSRSRWSDGETTLWARREPRRRAVRGRAGRARGVHVERAGRRDRGRRRRRAGDGRAGRRARRVPGAPAGSASTRPVALAAELPGGLRRGSGATGDDTLGLPPPRDRDLRRGAVRRGVEAPAAPPARLRRGRPQPVACGRFAIAVREVTNGELGCEGARRPGDGRRPRRGAGVRGLASARGCRPRTSGSSPPRRACSSAPSRSSGTGPRASTATAARASRSSRAARRGSAEGSDWYVDGGPQRPELLPEAAAPGRRARSARPRIGFRLAVDLVTRGRSRGSGSSRRRRSSRRRSPAMLLGDYGADVDQARAPAPARSGARARAGEGRRRALVQGARRATSASRRSTSRSPDGRRLFLRLARAADVVLENFRPGHARALGARLGGALGREPAGSCSRASAASASPGRTRAAPGSGRSPRR